MSGYQPDQDNEVESGGVILPLSSVSEILRSAVPDMEEMLIYIESQHGWLRFPNFLIKAIKNLRICDYPKLYESEKAMHGVALLAFMDLGEIKAFDRKVTDATLEVRGQYMQEFIRMSDDFYSSFEWPTTWGEMLKARRTFQRLTEEEKRAAVKSARYLLAGFLSNFHDTLSVMFHGQRLVALVQKAKAGDPDAFAKAVRIDNRIFWEIDYFQDRFQKARLSGDDDFCRLASSSLHHAPYQGRIKHKTAYMALSILQKVGWLDRLTDAEILDLLDASGVGHKLGSISDINGMGKVRRDYLALQQHYS